MSREVRDQVGDRRFVTRGVNMRVTVAKTISALVLVVGLGVLLFALFADGFAPTEELRQAQEPAPTTPWQTDAETVASSSETEQPTADNDEPVSGESDPREDAEQDDEGPAQEAQPPQDPAERLGRPAIEGRVVTPSGEPVPDALVSVRRPLQRPYSKRIHYRMPRQYTRTTADGRFRVDVTQPDPHQVLRVLPPPPHTIATFEPDQRYLVRAAEDPSTRRPPLEMGELVVPLGGAVEGRVLDEAGNPVAGARVGPRDWHASVPRNSQHYERYHLGDGTRQVSTGDDGRYRISGLLDGEHEFLVETEGFLPAQREGVDVRAEETVRDVDFQLVPIPLLTVKLQVRDSADEPIKGAVATFHEFRWKPLEHAEVDAPLRTDAKGRLSVDDIPGPTVRIEVQAEGFRGVRHTIPDCDDAEEPVRIEVTLKRTASITLRPVDAATGEPLLAREEGGAVTPVILDHNLAQRRGIPERTRLIADEQGRLHALDVPTGEQRLELSVPRYETWEHELHIEPGGAYELGDVPFDRGTVFEIEVRDPSGALLEGANVRVTHLEESSGQLRRRRSRDHETGAEGRVRSDPVVGSHVRFEASHDEHSRVTVTRENPPPGERRAVVRVRLEMHQASSVSGRAFDIDGDPLPFETVRLVRFEQRRPIASVFTQADLQGAFHFDGVEPGRYALVAGTGGGQSDYDYFDVREGDHVTQDVRDARRIEGVLLWDDGTVAGNLPLVLIAEIPQPGLHSQPETEEIATGSTDASGRFLLYYERGKRMSAMRVNVEPARHVHLRFHPGELPEVGEVRLPAARQPGRLLVHVTGANTSATVHIGGGNRHERVRRTVEIDGFTQFDDLPIGTYTLTVREQEWVAFPVEAYVSEERDSEATITLIEPAKERFRVELEGIESDGVIRPEESLPRVLFRIRPAELRRRFMSRSNAPNPHRNYPPAGARAAIRPGEVTTIENLANGVEYEASVQVEGYEPKMITFTARRGDDDRVLTITLARTDD